MKSTIVNSVCCAAFVGGVLLVFLQRSPAVAVQPAKPAAGVEYKVVQIRFSPGVVAAEPREFNSRFKDHAKAGWRYVDTIYAHPTARVGVAYILLQRTRR